MRKLILMAFVVHMAYVIYLIGSQELATLYQPSKRYTASSSISDPNDSSGRSSVSSQTEGSWTPQNQEMSSSSEMKTNIENIKEVVDEAVTRITAPAPWLEQLKTGVIQNFPVTALFFLLGWITLGSDKKTIRNSSSLNLLVYRRNKSWDPSKNLYTKTTVINLGPIYSSEHTATLDLVPKSSA
ncbi:hypothetical protein [Bdellovibrio bacteriovorus]|uniref:hypothetical protein n=1 Tax=Bdellovibrio bacteriovorus TaxID=959 RepID=UPI0035A607D6